LDELLTTRQLQEILQVDRITIYRMLAGGRLRGFKVGGQWRFPRRQIEAWLQNQQVQWSVEEEQVSPECLPAPHEALPLRCIQAIQDILAQAGKIGTLTIFPDGQPLTDISNLPPFCKLLLETEEGRVRCRQSWQDIASLPQEKPVVTSCHAGLTCVAAKVKVRGEVVASVLVGQFALGGPLKAAVSDGNLKALAQSCGIDGGELKDAAANVPARGKEVLPWLEGLALQAAETYSEIGEERLGLVEKLRRIAEISALAG